METIILIAAGLLAMLILYFKARRLFTAFKGDSQKSFCDCGNCCTPCAVRKIPDLTGDSDSNKIVENLANGGESMSRSCQPSGSSCSCDVHS